MNAIDKNEKCMTVAISNSSTKPIYLRAPFCWLLITFLTIFASSTRNALRILLEHFRLSLVDTEIT